MSFWILGPMGGKVGKVGKPISTPPGIATGTLSDLCDLPALRPEKKNRGADEQETAMKTSDDMPFGAAS